MSRWEEVVEVVEEEGEEAAEGKVEEVGALVVATEVT